MDFLDLADSLPDGRPTASVSIRQSHNFVVPVTLSEVYVVWKPQDLKSPNVGENQITEVCFDCSGLSQPALGPRYARHFKNVGREGGASPSQSVAWSFFLRSVASVVPVLS